MIKIGALILFTILFAAGNLYAANNTLTVNYPAPSGSYNKVILQTQASTSVTCSLSNLGMLFMDTGTNSLQLCAKSTDATGTIYKNIPFGETCFNRFWNSGGSIPPNSCPAGYSQAQTTVSGTVVPMVDSFSPDGGTTIVYSTTCCSSGSVILPSS